MALIKSSNHLEGIPSHFCCPGWPHIEALSAWLFLPMENPVYVLMIRGLIFTFLRLTVHQALSETHPIPTTTLFK